MSAWSEHVVGVPPLRLRRYVTSYVGYRYEGFPAGIHAGLPSQHLTFIVSLGDPLEVGELGAPERSHATFDALVGGLHEQPAAIPHDGSGHGLQLAVTPLGARACLGLPARELAGANLPLDTLLGRRGDALVDDLRAADTWQQRFAVLDALFDDLAVEGTTLPPVVDAAWAALTRSAGSVAIGELADEIGCSRRHLTSRFRDEIGIPPKTVGRIFRFDRARRLVTGSSLTLARVAAVCGYADQSHLVRDWHVFAGASPTGWLAAESVPFFPDDRDARPAG